MMTGQKILFFIIIGVAIAAVGLMFFLGPMLQSWFVPPKPDATITAVAIRATDVALSATEIAVAATKAAIEGKDQPQETLSGRPGSDDLTWEGLQIEITNVVDGAWPLIKAQNQNNEPPLQNRKMLLITVRISSADGPKEEAIALDDSDFQLIGSFNQLYTSWGELTGCGVVPDDLDGVVARNIWLEGNVCFQVPLDETGFKLIYQPRTGDYPALYFDVPEFKTGQF
jgi:hypothetical protein